MLSIGRGIAIDETELSERFVRASGPGGQNVNKVATAVELRFDVGCSGSLPADVKERLRRLAGARLTRDGVIVIRAERFRTQERNRADARERLVRLVRKAAAVPKRRIATKPPGASRLQRLEGKAKRSHIKALRRPAKPERD